MKLLTVADAADALSVSKSTLYALIEAGKIAVYRIGTGRGAIRIHEDDLKEFLASCRDEKQAEGPRKAPRRDLRRLFG